MSMSNYKIKREQLKYQLAVLCRVEKLPFQKEIDKRISDITCILMES